MSRIAWLLIGMVLAVDVAHGAEGAPVTAVYAMDADGGNVRQLASIPDYPIINSPEVSPDGKWVAVDGWRADENLRDARILLVNIVDGAVVNLGKGAMPSWSADGKWIALCKYDAERGVYIRSIDGTTERLIDSEGWGIQWAPNGLKAAYTRNGRFIIYDFISDKQHDVSPLDWPYRSVYWNCKWSSDSNQICFLGVRSDGRQEIGILDLTGGEARLRVRGDASDYDPDIAWHPDGSRITLPKRSDANGPGQIYVFDPSRFEPPTRLEGQPVDRANSGMCWSPDGQTLIFLSRGAQPTG